MLRIVVFVLLLGSSLWAGTTVQFSADPADVPTGAFGVGPFPSDVLTVADASQATGVRVNLPPSESSCNAESSPVCSNNALLNGLDGFSINPRIMACFSDQINTGTLQSGISIVSLANGSAISLNQLFYDPVSKCAFAKPNNVLNQASKYLLLVTNAVTDQNGSPVAAGPEYTACIASDPGPYCSALRSALNGRTAPGGGAIVAASLFTTMTTTTWLENARRFTDSQVPFAVPAGAPASFRISKLKRMTWVPDHAAFGSQDIPLSALANVDSVYFGLYLSPNYLSSATISGSPITPISYSTVSYHVFLPAVKKNARIPVVIFGHGMGDSQFGGPTYIASTLAANGFATLAIEFPGHGYGPAGRVNLTEQNGKVDTVLTPGRGTSSGSTIGSTDGCISFGPIGIRDCGRQAAIDLSALVHTIARTNGLGVNLDPSHIYYVGQSFGATVGTLFTAVDPAVPAAVLNGAGGTSSDIARLAISGRPLGLAFLNALGDPVLFNVAAGLARPEDYFHDEFNDNYPFKDQPPLTNQVAFAPAIQAAFEAADWIGMPGDPLAFAPHLKLSPLAGVPAKNVLFQFGYGDLEVPNPTESAVVSAAGAQSTTSFLDFQIAAMQQPSLLGIQDPATPMLPILPHRALTNPTIFTPGNEAELSLAIAEQRQMAGFFKVGGTSVPDANAYLTAPFSRGDALFETPIKSLPETLNFLQIPK